MKRNIYPFLVLFIIVIFRGSLVNFINNISSMLFIKDRSLETSILNEKIEYLKSEYNNLLDFKNNIDIRYNYTISNAYLNNYSFDKLLINGSSYHINDEVINENGLIGLITKVYSNYSEVSFVYDTNIAVKIGDSEGKIVSKDDNHNLVVKELSNYNNININDKVYSTNNTYIGKVIKIMREDVDTSVLVETINLKNINYVAVISRQA